MKNVQFNIVNKNEVNGLQVSYTINDNNHNNSFLAMNYVFINQTELINWIKDSLQKNIESMPVIEI